MKAVDLWSPANIGKRHHGRFEVFQWRLAHCFCVFIQPSQHMWLLSELLSRVLSICLETRCSGVYQVLRKDSSESSLPLGPNIATVNCYYGCFSSYHKSFFLQLSVISDAYGLGLFGSYISWYLVLRYTEVKSPELGNWRHSRNGQYKFSCRWQMPFWTLVFWRCSHSLC